MMSDPIGDLDRRARPHIRQRIIARTLLKHQTAGWSGNEKKPYRCTCGQLYAMGKRGDGLVTHQSEQIQLALDTPKRTSS